TGVQTCALPIYGMCNLNGIWADGHAGSGSYCRRMPHHEGEIMITLNINGQAQEVDVEGDTPLLWVLRDTLRLTGTKFGCGVSLCGACTVHVDGKATRSCMLPVSAAVDKEVVTIESIGDSQVGEAVQEAWQRLDVVQCGYCQSGQVMSAVALLEENKAPSDE